MDQDPVIMEKRNGLHIPKTLHQNGSNNIQLAIKGQYIYEDDQANLGNKLKNQQDKNKICGPVRKKKNCKLRITH